MPKTTCRTAGFKYHGSNCRISRLLSSFFLLICCWSSSYRLATSTICTLMCDSFQSAPRHRWRLPSESSLLVIRQHCWSDRAQRVRNNPRSLKQLSAQVYEGTIRLTLLFSIRSWILQAKPNPVALFPCVWSPLLYRLRNRRAKCNTPEEFLQSVPERAPVAFSSEHWASQYSILAIGSIFFTIS